MLSIGTKTHKPGSPGIHPMPLSSRLQQGLRRRKLSSGVLAIPLLGHLGRFKMPCLVPRCFMLLGLCLTHAYFWKFPRSPRHSCLLKSNLLRWALDKQVISSCGGPEKQAFSGKRSLWSRVRGQMSSESSLWPIQKKLKQERSMGPSHRNELVATLLQGTLSSVPMSQ